MATIGVISQFAERKIREKLSVPPDVVSIDHSPAGHLINPPIRMHSCGGRDQIPGLIYYRGWRGFEHPFPRLLEAALISAPDGLFFDVGANTGLYSLLSKSVCPKRAVHAFEPFPPTLEILKRNIALNSHASDIHVSDAATSDETGTAELFVPVQEHGLVETSASLSSTFKTSLRRERNCKNDQARRFPPSRQSKISCGDEDRCRGGGR